MKRYIHDGIGLRLMRGQENELAKCGSLDLVCPCGYAMCWSEGHALDLPDGWAPSMGGYIHPTGAEVQARGKMWAWFPKGVNTCALHHFKGSVEEAMIAAHPRWEKSKDWDGQPVYMQGLRLVYMDGDLWKHNRSADTFYLSPEAAMLAAEKYP